ncbi:MAG TPA: aconitate hydratase AcnA [Bordetella sp.]
MHQYQRTQTSRFSMQRTLDCPAGAYQYVDISDVSRRFGRAVETLPYVHRVLLENLARSQAWGLPVAENEIRALLAQDQGADLPLYVGRVILPDSSGLPVLQDLAALRDAVARAGGDASAVEARIPVDLIVDHSLQVDHWGDSQAVMLNLGREFQRNGERYRFLKWAQQAFRRVHVFPPGTGIIHQVNLERIATVVSAREQNGAQWAFPDFVIGGDSHTPTVNALGVLAWGVGGIDAEAAMLGQAYTFPRPNVVGVRLVGSIVPPALTTDAALLITQRLREIGVAGDMVEYFGPAVAGLTVQERATIANMSPEYGATCGFFAVDEQTLRYLRDSGRSDAQVELVKAYCQANHFWRGEDAPLPEYDRVVEIDLSEAAPSMAGPRRPQDRLVLGAISGDFRGRLAKPLSEGGFGAKPLAGTKDRLKHGDIVLAAITSCTNTSNPVVMLAAGLVARKAMEHGLRVPSWVKTSMAPGSRVVTQYLQRAGLLAPLETLGFAVIGYGCTTCGGKSGPLDPGVAEQITRNDLVVASVLSGNRNFEGRIHKLIRANYIGAPPMVVIYALAGRIDIDFAAEPVGHDAAGKPVFLRDLWPTPDEIAQLLPLANDHDLFNEIYDGESDGAGPWTALEAPQGERFAWDPKSSYLVEPPFFHDASGGNAIAKLADSLKQARVLAAFGDSLTTDHISPSGEIPAETPAGQYLQSLGVAPKDFNTFVGRRGNFEVMTRGTFANIRIKNVLLPQEEGGYTRHFPDDVRMTIFDAAAAYRQAGVASIILGGREYGTGSSRDWAAKGSALLGVRAVIAESYERIHRANLVGMGVLPLAFMPGQGWRQLGLDGSESFCFERVEDAVRSGGTVLVIAQGKSGEIRFEAQPQVLTEAERGLMAAGGIPAHVLQSFLSRAEGPAAA